jgi:hypothetical protein
VNIVNKNKVNDSDEINGIDFPYAAYYVSSKHENRIVKEIRKLLAEIETQSMFKKNNFPAYMHINHGPMFTIEKGDIDHLQKLIRLYDNKPCSKPLVSDVPGLSSTFRRYIYHVNKKTQNYGQVIHYTKNVQMLFSSWAYMVTPNTRRIVANHTVSELLSHFEDNVDDLYRTPVEMSIRDLNIDVEYMAFLLKTYGKLCG